MSTKEREMRFREAVRYMENASDILRRKAKKKNRYYEDEKHVRSSCAIAYKAVLLAAKTFLEINGELRRRKKYSRINENDLRIGLAKVDNNILNEFKSAFAVLYRGGYYEGECNYGYIQSGIDSAIHLINKIKPLGFESFKLN